MAVSDFFLVTVGNAEKKKQKSHEQIKQKPPAFKAGEGSETKNLTPLNSKLQKVSRNKKGNRQTHVPGLDVFGIPASLLFHQVYLQTPAAAFSHRNGLLPFVSTQVHTMSHVRFKNPAGPRDVHAPTSGAKRGRA